MNTQSTTILAGMWPAVGIAVFMILFVMIHACLKQSSMFSGWSAIVLAICTACLSVIGMGQMLVTPGATGDVHAPTETPGMPVILTPYSALGIFLLAMFLLMLLGKLFSGIRSEKKAMQVSPSEPTSTSVQKSPPLIPVDLPANPIEQSEYRGLAKSQDLGSASENTKRVTQSKTRSHKSKGNGHEEQPKNHEDK